MPNSDYNNVKSNCPTLPNRDKIMTGNPKYKDSVFNLLLRDKVRLLELYNALEGTHYGTEAVIEDFTLQNAVFLGRYNDICFTINGRFVILLEHQSSINENMCLRILLYIARVYESLIPDEKAIYKQKMIKLPAPEFFVLYNGVDNYPLESTMNLSEAFQEPSDALELTVKVININYKEASRVLEKSPTLKGYSYFVDRVRDNRRRGMTLEDALQASINECLDKGILKDFLKKHSSEVFHMLFQEFNLDDAKTVWVAEAKEEGQAIQKEIFKMLNQNSSDQQIQQRYNLTKQELEQYKKDFYEIFH